MLSRLSIDGWNLDALTGASAIVLALLPATGLAGERAARVCTRLGAKSTALPRHPPAAKPDLLISGQICHKFLA